MDVNNNIPGVADPSGAALNGRQQSQFANQGQGQYFDGQMNNYPSDQEVTFRFLELCPMFCGAVFELLYSN